ncbi:hypothetical protein D3C72_1964560 [compost metagenome]
MEKLRPYSLISSGYSMKYWELPATKSGARAANAGGRLAARSKTLWAAAEPLKIGRRLW